MGIICVLHSITDERDSIDDVRLVVLDRVSYVCMSCSKS
jgi:hypothetical protein